MKKFMFAAIAALVMVSVSNVFASSKMVSNAQVAPVDTVAPDAPSDTLAVGTPIQPQAGVEDSTQQENATEATTEATPTENATETTTENTTEETPVATEQQAIAE
ncbi:hypothetical protein [Segatella copri]|uniref:hypothetical protein n=1 Tax=Segatella copri TaxID=165179 RepID=UPI001F299FCB|nr:hypothetical protein [Segatella copri]